MAIANSFHLLQQFDVPNPCSLPILSPIFKKNKPLILSKYNKLAHVKSLTQKLFGLHSSQITKKMPYKIVGEKKIENWKMPKILEENVSDTISELAFEEKTPFRGTKITPNLLNHDKAFS